MKLAAYHRVEMIKMQHQAAPLDPKDKLASPPLDERLHIKFRYREQEKIFWVRKVRVASRLIHPASGRDAVDAHRGQSPRSSVCSI